MKGKKNKCKNQFYNLRYRPKDIQLNKFQVPDQLKNQIIFHEPFFDKQQVIKNNTYTHVNKQYVKDFQSVRTQQQHLKSVPFQLMKENIHKKQQQGKQGISNNRKNKDHYVQQGANVRNYLSKMIETPERIKQLQNKKLQFYQSKYFAKHQQLIDPNSQQDKAKYYQKNFANQKEQQYIKIQEERFPEKFNKTRNLKIIPLKTQFNLRNHQPPLENYDVNQTKLKHYPSTQKIIDRDDFRKEYYDGRFSSKDNVKIDTMNKRLMKGKEFQQDHEKINYYYPYHRIINFGGTGNK